MRRTAVGMRLAAWYDANVPKLHATTVRWDEQTYEYIRDEARHAGVTVSQFVREAAIIRAVCRACDRESPGCPLNMIDLAKEVERLARVRE